MNSTAPASPPLDPLPPTTSLVLFALAVVVPTLLAFNVSPSATVLNQVSSVALWGLLLMVLRIAQRTFIGILGSSATLSAPLLFCALACAWSWLHGPVPASLTLSSLAFIVVSLAVVLHGAVSRSNDALAEAYFAAWTFAGLLSASIAMIQVFQPEWADGQFIARSGLAGRAVGNVRQPNHLGGLLLWSSVALVPMVQSRRLPLGLGVPFFALFVFAIELSASRTGLIGVCVLAAWGLFDGRLSKSTRAMLVLAPLIYALGWLAMSLWATEGHHTFGAAARLAEKDLSGSRFGIWRDTLELIRMVPWTGVGFGEFNYAWSLTPFPHRPIAFFDHTHNLGLQFIVELGLPLGLLVCGLLVAALVLAFLRTWRVEGPAGASLRAAFVGVLLAAIHSALEYPLWYGYFLLPTAWAWGYALSGSGSRKPAEELAATAPHSKNNRASPLGIFLRVAGALMLAGSLFAVYDYLRVAQIFDPDDEAKPLEQRIAEGEKSVFFAHHAYYAEATVAEHPSQVWHAFGEATYYLLDTRLMMAWAKAFAERGDLDRARHIAQRLREFHNPASDEFFAPCDKPDAPQPKPWQCQPPSRAMDWRDFQSLQY